MNQTRSCDQQSDQSCSILLCYTQSHISVIWLRLFEQTSFAQFHCSGMYCVQLKKYSGLEVTGAGSL